MRTLLFITCVGAVGAAAQDGGAVVFDRAAAEHLLNRAGFGGSPEAIDALQAMGLGDAVEHLMSGAEAAAAAAAPYPAIDARAALRERVAAAKGELTDAERRGLRASADREDGAQLLAFRERWFERMYADETAVMEKCVLFWHGRFTSEQRDVRSSLAMIRQNETLRRHAFGSFRTLLREIARDPAMLAYLDGDVNRKRVANENFARELMELFTLGLGAYGEKDVTEAARAFTGWTVVDGAFHFDPRQHDFGMKRVLGRVGRFNGDDVIDVVLAEEAAPRFLASRLLAFYADADPAPDVVDRYAGLLRLHEWRIGPVLRALFLDPWFYAAERRGVRILGPVEFVVSHARRAPGGALPTFLPPCAADACGQSLFAPPHVKGWEGGQTWLSSAATLRRGAFALTLVGGFDPKRDGAFARPNPAVSLGATVPVTIGSDAERRKWFVEAKAADVVELVDAFADRLLGAPLSERSREALIAYARERSAALIATDLKTRAAARVKLAHLVLCLPEAHLS